MITDTKLPFHAPIDLPARRGGLDQVNPGVLFVSQPNYIPPQRCTGLMPVFFL
jgi:hypothetical protein